METPNGRQEITAMFGNPANGDKTLNESWEDQNIARALPPAGWHLYYQDDDNLTPVSGIRLHRKLHDSFREALDRVWEHVATELNQKLGSVPSDEAVREELHRLRVDQH